MAKRRPTATLVLIPSALTNHRSQFLLKHPQSSRIAGLLDSNTTMSSSNDVEIKTNGRKEITIKICGTKIKVNGSEPEATVVVREGNGDKGKGDNG